MVQKEYQSPMKKLLSWVRKQSKKVKMLLFIITTITLLVTLKLVVHDHNYFFVMAEAIHFLGLLILIYKLTTLNTCSGNLISLLDIYFLQIWKKMCNFYLIAFCVKTFKICFECLSIPNIVSNFCMSNRTLLLLVDYHLARCLFNQGCSKLNRNRYSVLKESY